MYSRSQSRAATAMSHATGGQSAGPFNSYWKNLLPGPRAPKQLGWARLTTDINNLFREGDLVRLKDVKPSHDTAAPLEQDQDGVNCDDTYLFEIEKYIEKKVYKLVRASRAGNTPVALAVPHAHLTANLKETPGTHAERFDVGEYVYVKAAAGGAMKTETYSGKQYPIKDNLRGKVYQWVSPSGVVIEPEGPRARTTSQTQSMWHYQVGYRIQETQLEWVTCQQWVTLHVLEILEPQEAAVENNQVNKIGDSPDRRVVGY
ncbi:hypothetical protein L226DRAFT_610067 [Lentinus tigrinus ALCF2SS1-7]|uniref:uncharacterized protein n=1 Tax=Lentinus tigrinus ALCF2SS1-7 TaxID=1328758 RepID=UPI0011662A02|nr:hypothetical protein L226DRAFT_610067 [Lentinus tigrinus ALCF2SS1-7]